MILTLPILCCVFLLAAFIHCGDTSIQEKVSSLSPSIRRKKDNPLPADYRFVAPGRTAATLPSTADELELVDVVILASVDGKLHGLNRTTGRPLWSMSDVPDSPHATPAAFESLVRTEHPSFEDSDEDFFIIEPQSGEIYVLPSTASPLDALQSLSISVPQLVEMSPFTFPGDEHRMFVGSKETSMLVIELDTGKVKGTIKADKECFWDDERVSDEEIDLDEQDGAKSSKHKLKSPEVHIGRTDYHIRVHSRHRGVIQNLFYSSYGPNNIDKERQAQWKRTPDDMYVQPLPNGQLLAFQTDGSDDSDSTGNDGMPIWGRTFKEPIVAVFDVVTTSSRSNPIALLQPRPHLEHLFPRRAASRETRIAHELPQVTYVGLVGDSLYALGPENFPLVVFDQEPPLASAMRIDEAGGFTTEPCQGKQCLVGSRRIEASSQWYVAPLLDSAPHVGLGQERVPFKPTITDGSANTAVDANVSWTHMNEAGWERWKYGEVGFMTWSAISGAVIFLLLLGRTLASKRRSQALVSPVSPPNNNTANQEAEMPSLSKTTETPASSSLPLSPAIEPVSPAEDDPPPPTPKQTPVMSYLPTPPLDIIEPEDGEESEKEGAPDTPRRKGPRRRKRGKKKKHENSGQGGDAEEDEAALKELKEAKDAVENVVIAPVTPITPVPTPSSSLIVTDTVLGLGSHGTVVYQGSLQGRAVAVKRLSDHFVTLAAREVELLQESDDHPNVIRYYYKEAKDGFLYIALELCPASLADIIERPEAFSTIARAFDPKRALAQVGAGLRHLHMLKIVHRDIKPQNILVSRPKNGQHRMLISDFGLCKKLEVDQSSFLPTMAAGTVGWRAPEILRGEVKLDEQPMEPDDRSSRGSNVSARSSSTSGHPTRLTRSVDVFALGCLFYYTLTNGSHPFGDRFEREVNIMKGQMNLSGLEQFGEEGAEAAHLITKMLAQDAKSRPDTTTCLIHPFFWTPARRLNFLQDASDRFEIMCRDPREPSLITLETGAYDVVGNDWHSRLDRVVIENLGKFRKYDGRSVQDLLRALRNKKHHYQDLPDHVKRHFGPLPEGFLAYFTRRFPGLFLHVHGVIWSCGLGRESMFRSYFELSDP